MGRSRVQLLWYYGELAAIFADRRPDSQLASELSATVAALVQTL